MTTLYAVRFYREVYRDRDRDRLDHWDGPGVDHNDDDNQPENLFDRLPVQLLYEEIPNVVSWELNETTRDDIAYGVRNGVFRTYNGSVLHRNISTNTRIDIIPMTVLEEEAA